MTDRARYIDVLRGLSLSFSVALSSLALSSMALPYGTLLATETSLLQSNAELAVTAALPATSQDQLFQDNDRVALLGATLVERMQMRDELESILVSRLSSRGITFRNVAWSGDDASGRARAVFGGYEEGYQRRLKDLQAAKPNHVLVCYGINESFDNNLSLETFNQQINRLLDDLTKAGYKLTIALPPVLEAADKDERLQNYKNRHPKIAQALVDIANQRQLKTIQLPIIPTKWTTNGVHLNAAGYSLYSQQLAQAIAPSDCSPQLDTTQNITLHVSGNQAAKIVSLGEGWNLTPVPSKSAEQWQWTEKAGCLPLPLPVASEQIPVDNGYGPYTKLSIQGLNKGSYALLVNDKEVLRGTHEQWQQGVNAALPALQSQTEQLRRALHRKNELFFHHYRPQNETYLFLFRKHEQGNNAVEIDQFPPIIEPLEAEIKKLAETREYVWILRKVAE